MTTIGYFTAGPQDPDVITGPWLPRHDDERPVLRDKALPPEPSTEEILADVRRIHPHLRPLADLVETNPEAFASAEATVADVAATIARYGRGSTEIGRAA